MEEKQADTVLCPSTGRAEHCGRVQLANACLSDPALASWMYMQGQHDSACMGMSAGLQPKERAQSAYSFGLLLHASKCTWCQHTCSAKAAEDMGNIALPTTEPLYLEQHQNQTLARSCPKKESLR